MHDGFSTISAFESWFPKRVNPTADEQIPSSKDTQVSFQINGARYILTPSNVMTGSLPERAGYKSVTGVRYKCNASSHEVKIAFGQPNENANTKNLTNIASASENAPNSKSLVRWQKKTDSYVCKFASKFINALREAKRRGLSCGVDNISGQTTNASESTNLRGYKLSNPQHPQTFAIIFPDSKEVFLTSKNKWFKKIYESVKNGRVKTLGVNVSRRTTTEVSKPTSFSQTDLFRISNQKNIEGLLFKLPKGSAGYDLRTGKWLRFCIDASYWFCAAALNVERTFNQASYQMLSLVIDEKNQNQAALNSTQLPSSSKNWLASDSDSSICGNALFHDGSWRQRSNPYVQEAKRRGLSCGVPATQVAMATTNEVIANQNDITICARAIVNQSWDRNYDTYVKEAALRGIGCGVKATNPFSSGVETAQNTQMASSVELDAERKKRIQAEQELAALKAEKEHQQQNIAADGQPPVLTAQANVDGSMASIFGSAADNIGVAELLVDGLPVQLSSDGSFETSLYVPRNGKQVAVTVFDLKGNQTDKTLSLQRSAVQQASGPVFGSLNPSGKRVMPNNDALALIIGVADYERTPAKAAYADKDAKTFYDYAMLKLGIPASNIKELVNTDANRIDVGLAVKDWVARSTKQNVSDIYVFFAGHGLASQSGEEMYLLPYDGEPRLLEDSAIKRTRLFDDIASANPRSVTVFLDTCYSGTTRGTDMLIASRPIAIRALPQSVPDNFTVMTAAAGDQTAKPLEEAKHGMFSYFLMKGMEGEADANQDNRITAGELHSYVQTNVIQQSSGSQTPELQGDADRVLVQFQ